MGKALDRIAWRELIPSGSPGAQEVWPLQEGQWKQTEGHWDFGDYEYPIQVGESWPLAISPSLGTRSKQLRAAEPDTGTPPDAWSNNPPEPLSMAIFLPAFGKPLSGGLPAVQSSRVPHGAVSSGAPAGTAPGECRMKAEVVPLEGRRNSAGPDFPSNSQLFEMPRHGGPVAVQGTYIPLADAADSRQLGIAPRESRPTAEVIPLPARAGSAKLRVLDRALHPMPARHENWMPSLAPGAAVRQVLPSVSTDLRCGIALSVPDVGQSTLTLPQVAARGKSVRPPAAEPAAIAVSARFSVAPAEMHREETAAVLLPDLARLQPIADADADLDPLLRGVAIVSHSSAPAMAGLQPAAVQSLFSMAFEPVPIALNQELPALRLTAFDLPFPVGMPVPCAETVLPVSGSLELPAPVESLVTSCILESPALAEPDVRAIQLPEGQALNLPSASLSAAFSILPAPAQSEHSFSLTPLPAQQPALALSLARTVKPGTRTTLLHLARTAPGRAPSPADSLPGLAAFAAFRISNPPATQLPQVPPPNTAGLSAAGSGRSYPRSAAPGPPESSPNSAILKLISTLQVNPLALPAECPVSSVPQPGFIPIEFYCQRSQVAPHHRLSWVAPSLTPILPRMALRIAVDRTEDLAPWKPTPQVPDHNVPAIPDGAKRLARNRRMEQALKIAACLVMGAFIWFGARELRTVNRGALGTSAAANSPGALPAIPAADAASKGALATVRQAISNRAAYTVTDTLKSDMQSWGVPAKSWVPGWSRNPDGYTHTGELALFRPSLTFKDYRLEFFGQIENKSMGWVVRAQDVKNYYAMKFTVVTPGLRPIIAMAHYPVVGGRKGHRVEAPLSVMVHRNTPFRVAVDVQGNRVTASIEGQQVDSWTDDLLPAGGVGFFSEAGERARLYWMKVSKNQDWLGSICSYLSGASSGDSHDTAEVWGQGIPSDIPAPTAPQQPAEVALAEADARASGVTNPQRARIWV